MIEFCEDCGGIQSDQVSAAIPPNKSLVESPSTSTAPVTRNSRSTLLPGRGDALPGVRHSKTETALARPGIL